MSLLSEKRALDPWLIAAAVVGCTLWFLALSDVLVWHPGFAHGDETHIIGYAQLVREGMPMGWTLSQGCIHRLLLIASMSLWPGSFGATSAPALAGLALEGGLLFVLGRRLGGSRVGFFAVVAGMASAFTLVRSRVSLSFCLFPAEWLLMVWIRPKARFPWQWVLWGGALGLLCFDYEGWLPAAALMLLLPFPDDLPLKRRAWEFLGLALVLLLLLPPEQLSQYFMRRRQASFLHPGSPSAGWAGLRGLILGGADCLPYMAPPRQAVFPLGYLLVLPLGLALWRRRVWVPLAAAGLGLALPLMGGAPYGLPAHRAITGWPALVLLVALGLDQLALRSRTSLSKALLALVLLAAVGQQLLQWQSSQIAMDEAFRAPIRDLQRGAQAAWNQSQVTGYPLVTETHPTQAPLFRFLTGHPIPMPDARAQSVVAFIPWEYLPGVRKQVGKVATFQESPGSAPVLVGVLTGPLASEVLEAEREFRPLLQSRSQWTESSALAVRDWLRRKPGAGPWARTLAADYLLENGFFGSRLPLEWMLDTRREHLVSARPLLTAVKALEYGSPDLALEFSKQARGLDPFNAGAWMAERRLLLRLGRTQEAEALDKAREPYDHGLLFAD